LKHLHNRKQGEFKMKKPPDRLITIIAIIFMFACGGTPQPVSNQVATVVAATMEWLSVNAPTNAPTDAPTNMPTEPPTNIATDMPTNTPTETLTSTPTGTPTNTFTPTTASLVVFNVRKLPPLPTPTPEPCNDPPCLGSIPSGDYIYIEHAEMNTCNASNLCRSFYPNDPNFRWNFNPSSDICVLWIEEGHRAENRELSIKVYQNNQLLVSDSVSPIGDRLCRVADIPITARGDYKTTLDFGGIEFNLLWSIK
jgi:hypothetical protein